MPDAGGNDEYAPLYSRKELLVIVITCFAIWGSFQADRLGRMALPCTPEQRIELEQSL